MKRQVNPSGDKTLKAMSLQSNPIFLHVALKIIKFPEFPIFNRILKFALLLTSGVAINSGFVSNN